MDSIRPKLTCDEEELLKMQEDFVAGRVVNSDTSEVIRAPQVKSTKDSGVKKSIFAQRRGAAEKGTSNSVHFEFPQFQVLKDVVEKCVETPEPQIQQQKRENAFPEVFQRKKSLKISESGSIFAQQLKKAKMVAGEDVKTEFPSASVSTQFDQQCSAISKTILGETESIKIHQENMQKLSLMTNEDILREQQQLLKNLDPKIVAFLKHKKTTVAGELKTEKPNAVGEAIESEHEHEIGEIGKLTNSTWIHMDKIEKEKVRWMSALPPIKEIPGKSFQARFDFNGHLLPANADLPETTALYHHGEEPERAGYSINELMRLSRSSNLQQRILALNTLAKVLENTRLGIFDSCFEAPLVSSVLDNELLTLLRVSMDDKIPAVVTAALITFSRLISSPFDESCLERCYSWHSGEEQPNLCTLVQMDSVDLEQETEIKDNEMIQVDVIKVCLRMDILWRIRYILEEIRPEARAVVASIEILTRIARHSPDAALSILDFPRLMQSIFNFFLPFDWQSLHQNQGAADNVYGSPVRQVLRLARVIASWNIELATKLVDKYSLLESIKIYVAMDTAELKLPTQEALLLVLDCYHTWRTLIRQGIGMQSFLDYFPASFSQLLYFRTSVSMDGTVTSSNARFSHQLGSSMLLFMEAMLSMCCRSGTRQHVQVMQVGGLREVVEMCVMKWTGQLRQLTNPIPESAGCLLAAGIQLLGTFFTLWNDPQASSLLDQLCTNHMLPLLHSEQMDEMAKSLIRHSNLASTLQSCSRNPETLPSVNATAMDGELVPILAPSSPFPLITSIFRLLRIWKTKCASSKGIELKVSAIYFDYLAKLSRPSTAALSSNWFTRYEIRFLHEFLMMAAEWCTLTTEQSKFVHQAALTAITSIPSGEEAIAKQWITKLIFQKDFVKRGCDLETKLEVMHLDEPSPNSLLTQALNELDQVATFFNKHLFPVRDVSLTMLTLEHRQILPADWIYLPLVMLYQRELEKSNDADKSVSETALLTLRAVYVLLSLQPTWFFRIEPTAHYARLACTFMAANDLFLEEKIGDYMWPILRKLATHRLDFSRPVEGVNDFIELYDLLLNQFEAVSYGSPLFGAFILLPLQQSQQVRFRLKLWCEHSNALRLLTLTEQQMLDSMTGWLEPIETNEVLIMKYGASTKSQLITSQRNPVLFEIAIHHINKFMERNAQTV